MSLINKMLQDLDARGGQPGPATGAPEIKPVPAPARAFPWLRVALIGGLVVVLGGSGYMAWKLQRQQDVAVEEPVNLSQAPQPAPVVGPVVETPVAPAPAPVEPEAVTVEPAPAAAVADTPLLDAAPVAPAAPAVKKPAPAVKREAAVKPAPALKAAPKAAAPSGRVETTAQRAENGYRRALLSLEDGRVTEAIGHLEGALRADPRHEAARQTLVGLLIEAKRPEEAIRQLGAALALDARQPAMAMLLARLQLERGSPGIDTLTRTLPYAANNGEYRAFLAGALAREGRHREAAEHYSIALGTAPQNGVWWMGMAMSLQAENRTTDAAAAYRKARDSGKLTPELQGFVERKLKELGAQ